MDLRNFSLEDKNQYRSLYRELNAIPTKLNAKQLLYLNSWDDLHLSDIGTKRVKDIIFKNHFKIKNSD